MDKVLINLIKMKKIFLFVTLFLFTVNLIAQVPQSFNYQAVVRDVSGNIIADTQVGMRISILQGSVTGTAVCEEEFTPTTNTYGLVTLAIGSLNATDFSVIDWFEGPYFVKVEFDPTGGTNYIEMGISQLLSVPYALLAKTVETVDYIETDPVFGASVAKGITTTDTIEWNAKLDSFSEVDPIYGASVAKGITEADTASWNAKSNFSGSYTDLTNKPTLFSGDYNDLTNKPTTLSGYGITDGISTSNIIKGIVDGDSRVILTGEGFTFSYIETGHYRITFSSPFNEIPVAVATDNSSANYIIGCTETKDYIDIWVRSHAGGEGNTIVSFIVIGN